jgi:hypothetical protein
VTVDEAQEAPDVVLDTFSVDHVLDFRASHSFISVAYVEKNNIPVATLKCRMVASSPRGDMPARPVCLKVKIILRLVEFSINLIILDSKGCDSRNGLDEQAKGPH